MSPQPDTKHKHHSVLHIDWHRPHRFIFSCSLQEHHISKPPSVWHPPAPCFCQGMILYWHCIFMMRLWNFRSMHVIYVNFLVFQITLIHHLIWKAFQWRERRKLRDMHSTLQENYVTIKSMSILKIFFKPVPLTECLANVHF